MDNKEKMFQGLKMVMEACEEIEECIDCPFYAICDKYYIANPPYLWDADEKIKKIFEFKIPC